MRATNPDCPNFLDQKNLQFRTLHGTLDSHFRHLHESGIGRKVKNAELISKADENKLWRSGVLVTSTPRSLFNTVFFYNGKNFCLRGGEEHRQLHLSQLKRFSDSDLHVYYENCSKNRAGTFRQKRIKWYQYTVLCVEISKERCHVHLFSRSYQTLPWN